MSSDSPLSLTFGARSTAFLQASEDFKKQRITVTRRIHKLKKYLKIQSKDSKNYKPHVTSQEQYDSNDKYYLLNLLLAERDFLYAIELQRSLNTEAKAIKSRQVLILTRLKKALKYASHLVELSSGREYHVEALIYKEILEGYYSVNNRKWEQAIKSYSIARVALQFLESGDKENVLYNDIIDELIDESFKLAIYRSMKLNTVDLNEFSKKIAVEKLNQHEISQYIASQDPEFLKPLSESDLIRNIGWRSYNARVKDETTARTITKVTALELADLEAFGVALALWQDAIDSHSSYIHKNADQVAETNDDDEDQQDDEILSAYLKYSLLSTRVQRDATLLTNANKTQSLRILTTIEETLREILELPGVYSDDELFENLNAVINYFKAAKSQVAIEHYFNKRQYVESLALSSAALEQLQASELTIEFPFITSDKLQESIKTLQTLQKNAHVLAIISTKNKNVTLDALSDTTQINTDLTKIFNPKIEPVPVKPVLFDLAFNYINYDVEGTAVVPQTSSKPTNSTVPLSSITSAAVAEEDDTLEKKKGFFGLFGR
ncbi:hypothetical protein WICPIJ_004887 [Wickerhamomyces pijperi]|uniref:Signal recognition particle subunit SRP68 n=1 Tax=Wickerhamomyces pijperi TaxID=599730 RepID=A0A9P8Q541_WICPI|nr:hypothetical protein WICPIJ_004887 [Wickerhamomyces pijperi]